jgi:hypothetical protein
MSWWKWWEGLQPPTCLKGGELIRELACELESDSWEETRKGSQNGFFTVLLTLAWWRKAAAAASDVVHFKAAFDNVSWVADCMLRAGKRARDDDSAPGPSKKARR